MSMRGNPNGSAVAHPKRPAARRWLIGSVLVLLAIAGAAGLSLGPSRTKGPSPHASAPTAVRVALAERAEVPLATSAPGTVQPLRSVTLQPRVSGTLVDAPFTEGAEVKAGDVLARIDPRPFAANVAQAEGALERDDAQLAQARIDLARYDRLDARQVVARAQRDTQAALVRQLEGSVEASRGALAAARLELEFATLRAPFDGRVGVRLVDPGNVVGEQTPGLVVLTQTRPIAVRFGLPQGDLDRLGGRATGQTVQAIAQETGTVLGEGRLDAIDNRIDPATGTVLAKARFDNADGSLWPGRLVNVRLVFGTLADAIVVPATSVRPGPRGPLVWTVRDGIAHAVDVELGASDGSRVVVTRGIAAGAMVVIAGQDGLREGGAVKVHP